MKTYFDLSPFTFFLLGFGLLSIVFWFIVRKKNKRAWLPTLRVIPVKNRTLKIFRLQKPPLALFLFFLFSLLSLMFFSTKPYLLENKPQEKALNRVHIFVDLSPSVMAYVSKDEYFKLIKETYKNIPDKEISLSTSLSKDVYSIDSEKTLHLLLDKMSFHREGVQIGSLLKKQLNSIGKRDALIVLSDGDEFSWNDFNWKYLIQDTEVFFYDIAARSQKIVNRFIADVRQLNSDLSTSFEYEITIEQSGFSVLSENSALSVIYKDLVLEKVPFKMDKPGHIVLQVSLSSQRLNDLKIADNEPLLFRIENQDTEFYDDEFRVFIVNPEQAIEIIADPGGESLIEDPSYKLSAVFSVLGFSVRRSDYLEKSFINKKDLRVFFITDDREENICADDIERIQKEKNKENKKIWLIPFSFERGYKNTCWCYAQYSSGKRIEPRPSFCNELSSVKNFAQAMDSLGSKQIGGKLDSPENAVAWESSPKNNIHVLAFSIPLSPDSTTGLRHGKFPLLIKSLLTWQKIFPTEEKWNVQPKTWPRHENIEDIFNEKDYHLLSNVPYGESILKRLSAENLPPQVNITHNTISLQNNIKIEKKSDIFIQIFCLLIIAALVGETVWFGLRFRQKI